MNLLTPTQKRHRSISMAKLASHITVAWPHCISQHVCFSMATTNYYFHIYTLIGAHICAHIHRDNAIAQACVRFFGFVVMRQRHC